MSDTLEIKIPGKRNGVLKFSRDSLSYKDTTLKYSEITKISCRSLSTRVNFLTAKHEFYFSFSSNGKKVKVYFQAPFNIGLKEKTPIYSKIYTINKKIVVPEVVDTLVREILESNKIISIGSVYFDKRGYFKKRFLRKDERVTWSDDIAEPRLIRGHYVLYKKEKDEFKTFSAINLANANAILIPELVQALYSIFHSEK
jgi:hypothetical protein